MADKTGIEWTDATWNFLTGCSRVSAGCDNCYAVRVSQRIARIHGEKSIYYGLVNEGKGHFNGTVKFHRKTLFQPFRWKRRARRIFVNSMSDTFHPKVRGDILDEAFAVMALSGRDLGHEFQVLTKRPGRALEYFSGYKVWSAISEAANLVRESRGMEDGPPIFDLPNVILGTSVENQEAADHRIPILQEIRKPFRHFLSLEPLLGPIDLDGMLGAVDWVILGGESGPKAKRREIEVDWLQEIIHACDEAQVPVFVKQDSGSRPGLQGKIPDEIWARKEFPRGALDA